MAYKLIQSDTLQGIADAIRGKTEKTEAIPVTSFADEITNMEGGTEDLTAELTEQDTLLTSIEDALGTGVCTLTIRFMSEHINWDTSESAYYDTLAWGQYAIGEAPSMSEDAVSFEKVSSLTITGFKGDEIYVDLDGYASFKDAEGCSADGGWDSGYDYPVHITLEDKTASIVIYYVFY